MYLIITNNFKGNKFSFEICNLLLQEPNIDVTIKSIDGETPLHYFVRQVFKLH